MIPPEPGERGGEAGLVVQMAPQRRPEHKHGLGLVEERETPFIYGHVWVWDTIIER